MLENVKNALAKANGFDNERRVELIRERVREEFPNTADEIAVLRKAIAYLFDLIATLHHGELNNEEFAKYNAFIEHVKAITKEELK